MWRGRRCKKRMLSEGKGGDRAGAIHTLIYVNGVLTTVGQNDYIEYDVEAEEVRGLLTKYLRF
jgi:hypothetical protein